MPCNTKLKKDQTMAQRAAEVRKRIAQVDALLSGNKVGVKVGPQGAIVFTGLADEVRDGMTDGCIYRTLSRSGSSAARMAITRAERMAGRTVDRKVVSHGTHSHDDGHSWHPRG